MDRYNRQMVEITSGDKKFAVKTAACTLGIYEQVIRANTTTAAFTITLPNVVEAKGMIFSIFLETDGGDLTIQDQDESYDWTDLTCDDALDGYLLMSDGYVWWTIASRAA